MTDATAGRLTPGQLARVRKEAERALRELGALGVFPTPVDRIMAVARVAEVKEDVLNPGFVAKLRAKAEQAGLVPLHTDYDFLSEGSG